MSVCPEDFSSLARQLIEGGTEIELRAAVSRGYYALYHEAERTAVKLRLEDKQSRSAGAHERLFGRYEAQGKRLKVIAHLLRAKRRLRVVADYHLADEVDPSEAVQFLFEAERLAKEIAGIKDRSAHVHKK